MTTFLAQSFFRSHGLKSGQSQKSCYNKKSVFSLLVNHMKEFLKSVHTGVVFLQFLARASNGRQYSRRYFSLKIGKCSVYDKSNLNFRVNLEFESNGFDILLVCIWELQALLFRVVFYQDHSMKQVCSNFIMVQKPVVF